VITQASADHVTLVRNPHFHVWSADARPAGFPDVISWALQPNAGRALTEVENGHADVMLDQPPAARSKELRTTYAPLIHPYVVLETSYIAFNTRRPPFSSVLARRAVNLAVDRRRVVALQGGTEVRTPTCQVLPPTMFGYRPYCPYTVDPNPASGIWKGPNPKRALALIRTSGTHGDAVVLRACACVGVSRSMVDYVASLLTRLGYHVNQHWFPNTSTGYQAYSNATGDPALPLVVIEGWYADYPYPTDFFEPLLMCGTGTEPGIKFCDPHLDHLVHSALTAQGAAALDEWQAADREAVDQAAWAPLSNLTGIDVIGRRLGDYQRNPQFGEILDQLWVK
jgi:peptide/nickel transport system substrate-binding protein